MRTIIYKESFEADPRFPPALAATSKETRHEVLATLFEEFQLELTIATLWKRRVRPPPESRAGGCYRIYEPVIDKACLVSKNTDQTMGTSQGICALFNSSSASSYFGLSVFSYIRDVHVFVHHQPGQKLADFHFAFFPDAPPVMGITRNERARWLHQQWYELGFLECSLMGDFHIWKCDYERYGEPQVFGMGLWEVLWKSIHDHQKVGL